MDFCTNETDKLRSNMHSSNTKPTTSKMFGHHTSRVFLSTRQTELPIYSPIEAAEPLPSPYCETWLKLLSAECDQDTIAVPKQYEFDAEIVGMKKRHLGSHTSCYHTTETLQRLRREIQSFGYSVNEMEYSASLMFQGGVRIGGNKYERDMMYWNRRRYYKSDRFVASNGRIITSDPCLLSTGDKRTVVLRLDEREPGTHTDYPYVTAKLKLLTDHLLVNGCRINLTASIEAQLKDSSFAKRDTSKSCWSKRMKKNFVCRRFCYWKLVTEHEGRSYDFRVAFRQKEKRDDCYTPLEHGFNPEENVEMNVECETPISRIAFVDIFHALTLYYKYMWLCCSDNYIRPVMKTDTWNDFNSDEDWREKLSDVQFETLRSLRLTKWTESCSNQVNENISHFVKFLALQTYVSVESSILSTSETLSSVHHSNSAEGIVLDRFLENSCNDSNENHATENTLDDQYNM